MKELDKKEAPDVAGGSQVPGGDILQVPAIPDPIIIERNPGPYVPVVKNQEV